jgi:DNA invertase Pin-like site-specific DNA recombinase
MNAVGYVRTSTKKQKNSPARQESGIRCFCNDNDINLEMVFFDIAVSGAKPIAKREGLSSLFEYLDTNDVDFLVVEARDRLARDSIISFEINDLTSTHTEITPQSPNHLPFSP